MIGDGARSQARIRILASVLDLPLRPLAEGEHGGTFGAAVRPDPGLARGHAERRSRYRGPHPALRALSG